MAQRTTAARWQVVMWVALVTSGCFSPPPPSAPHPPALDRYERAASPDPAARASAADELIYDPSVDAPVMLLTLLQRDTDPAVRTRAANALAMRRDTSYEAALEAAAQTDPDPQVRAAAAAAYERLWPWRKRPGTAAALSLLCPGCGQFYLRNHTKGALELGAFLGLTVAGVALIDGHEIALEGGADSAKVPIGTAMVIAAQNLWFFSIFDAYRDARVLRHDEGYAHAITREALGELVVAPFNPRILKSPWVWAGVPLALAAGIGASYLVQGGTTSETSAPSIFDVRKVNVFGHAFNRGSGFLAGAGYFAALFGTVGVGEEALFRGVIQTELEERLGPTWGLVAGSAIFGSVHVLNFLQNDPKDALFAVPFITVVGASLGLAYQHTGYKLGTSVAMHFWYDTLLSMAAFAADPEHQPFVVNYASAL